MAHAPTRPPGRNTRSERRKPPRGPRTVPLSPRDQRAKKHFETAAKVLREQGKEEEAATVASMLTPVGAALIQRLHLADRTPVTLHLFMPVAERDHYHQSAKDSGDLLSTLAEQALYEIAEGIFRPARYTRPSPRTGPATDEATLSLKVDKRLKDKVAALLKNDAFLTQLGWKPTSAALLVRLWLQERYPMDPDQAPAGSSRFTPEQVSEIVRRYKGSASEEPVGTNVLAREYGVHPTTIIRVLDREGVERRPTRSTGTSDS